MILGIQDLEREVVGMLDSDRSFSRAGSFKTGAKQLHNLFAKDIDDMVVRNEEDLIKFKIKKAKSGAQPSK